ncbi:MAG: VIT family protein [Propioniciclava sp.]
MSDQTSSLSAAAAHAAAETSSHSPLLNKLRAAVLGANDGIISTAGMVMGVAGATTDSMALLVAGIAAMSAGALSMAVGEYVSVSAQRDTERALLTKERWELENLPEEELAELASLYEAKGLTPDLAREVAAQLTEHDALGAHAEAELGIDPDELVSPWAAAWASMGAFTLGALIPLLAIVMSPPEVRVTATVAAVVVALILTGYISARVGGSRPLTAVVRVVSGGLVAMGVTYAIGSLVGMNLG